MGDIFGGGGGGTNVTIATPPPPAPPPPPVINIPAPEISFPQPSAEDVAFQRELQKAYLDRINGRLEVPVALEQDIQAGEAKLRQSLIRSLGPGYETSTPGQQALRDFTTRAEALRDQARHGNPADTSTLLSGFTSLNAQQNQLALAQAQAEMGIQQLQAETAARMGLAGYQAQLDYQRDLYRSALGAQGYGGAGPAGGASGYSTLGSIGGLGLAYLLTAKNKPWWLGGSTSPTMSEFGPYAGAGGYQFPGGLGDVASIPGLTDFNPASQFTLPDIGAGESLYGPYASGYSFPNFGFDFGTPSYSAPSIDLGGSPSFDYGSLYPSTGFDLGSFNTSGFNFSLPDFSGFDFTAGGTLPDFNFSYPSLDFGGFY